MHRRPRPCVQMALAERAAGGDEHRLVRAEQQERREIDGVRHRHRRAAREERQLDFERGRRRGQHEEHGEQDRLVESREREAGRKERRARDDDPGDVHASGGRQWLCQWTRGRWKSNARPSPPSAATTAPDRRTRRSGESSVAESPSSTAPSLRSAVLPRPFWSSTRVSSRRAPTEPNAKDPTRRTVSTKTPVPRADGATVHSHSATSNAGSSCRTWMRPTRRSRGAGGDRVGEGQTGRAFARGALDEPLHRHFGMSDLPSRTASRRPRTTNRRAGQDPAVPARAA